MTSAIELSSDTLRCQIAPELGGVITGLWLGEIAVLRSTPIKVLTAPRQGGSYALVLFSNRAGQATLQWAGTGHPLVQNRSNEPHAIHGVGWHPYFVKRARSHISFKADARWEIGADKLPTPRVAAHGLDSDCAMLDVDHCFEGWSGAASADALGVRVLQPGESMSAEVSIQVEPAP